MAKRLEDNDPANLRALLKTKREALRKLEAENHRLETRLEVLKRKSAATAKPSGR
jgi:hypothetical protein